MDASPSVETDLWIQTNKIRSREFNIKKWSSVISQQMGFLLSPICCVMTRYHIVFTELPGA